MRRNCSGLVCRRVGGWAGRPPPRQSPSAGPGAFPSLARRSLPTARAQRAKPPMRPGGVSPDDHLLPPRLHSLPSSSPPEKPITFLRVRAPWLFCSLNLGPCRRRGMIQNQHCQHFAPSLVQGRLSPCPPPCPLPSSALTTHKQPDGQGAAADALRGPTST